MGKWASPPSPHSPICCCWHLSESERKHFFRWWWRIILADFSFSPFITHHIRPKQHSRWWRMILHFWFKFWRNYSQTVPLPFSPSHCWLPFWVAKFWHTKCEGTEKRLLLIYRMLQKVHVGKNLTDFHIRVTNEIGSRIPDIVNRSWDVKIKIMIPMKSCVRNETGGGRGGGSRTVHNQCHSHENKWFCFC